MNPFTLNINTVITISLAAQLVLSFASSSSVLRVQRRVPDNVLQLKESTTTLEPEIENIDDVFAIPIDDFRDYWYGRRLKKRSLLGYDEEDTEKRSQFQTWGGKRAGYPDIFQVPKGFNPNGGKRFDVVFLRKTNEGENSRKRTAKAFQNWAGKRANNGKPFEIWGGKKRAGTFKTWGGKRADSFRTWGGKKSDSFRTWGGKRSE